MSLELGTQQKAYPMHHDHCHPHPRCHHRRGPRPFFGGLLVLGGGAALLMHFGVLKGIALWKLWPLALVWVGVLKLVRPGHWSRRLSGLVMLAVAAVAQAHYLGYLHWHWNAIWPILVIGLGVKLLLRSHFHPRRSGAFPAAPSDLGGNFELEVMLGGRQDTFDGRPFSGGVVRCTLGGYELDLRGAQMVGEEAILELDVTMGGVELRVPRNWRVDVESSPFMAAVENHTSCSDPTTAKHLIVRGRVVMGGVEIKN